MSRKTTTARKPKRATKREPTPQEEGQQILVDAETAGKNYAQEQVGSPNFRDWVSEQMGEAEAMRRRDPASVLPSDTPASARKIARNMLQQLEWDTKRDLESHAILELIPGASGVFDIGNADWVKDKYGITLHDVTEAFYSGFGEELHGQDVEKWLTDLVLETSEELRGGGEVGEARRHPAVRTDRQLSLINTPDDMEWLRDVHLPDLDLQTYHSAVLYGWHEDSPTRIDVYTSQDPTVDDRPVTYEPDSEGKFHIGAGVTEARRVRGDGPDLPEDLKGAIGTLSHNRHFSIKEVEEYLRRDHPIIAAKARYWVRELVKLDYVRQTNRGEYYPTTAGWRWIEGSGSGVDPQTWAEPARERAARGRRHSVRDYIAVDPKGRTVAGPFADYGEAKREAARARGFVRFAAPRRAAESRRPLRRR